MQYNKGLIIKKTHPHYVGIGKKWMIFTLELSLI